MTGQVYRGFLRQLSTGSPAPMLLPPYLLSEYEEMLIGRDPKSCQLVLNSNEYLGVSRRHAAIRPVPPLGNGLPHWEICDMSSANGTYVNGYCLRGCQLLQTGDRITLGQDGPTFIFECQFNAPDSIPAYSTPQPTQFTVASSTPLTPPAGNVKTHKPDAVTFTQLFPLASTGKHLTEKGFLGPAILTVIFVVLMFASIGQQDVFNMLVATYIAGAAYYFVYQLCGKPKSWTVILFCASCTALMLVGPILPLFITIFRDILPGSLPEEGQIISLMSLFIRMLFGAGLMEELLKALPILGVYSIGTILPSPWRERIGVWEPLDGILLGAASAVGFTLVETLGQYVPNIINDVMLQTGGNPQELGLQLLIARVLGSVAGHMAYTGYFGYFIGLSILKRRQRWQILGIGYICASILHALWNTAGFFSPVLLAVVGILSYAFLAAAILKARAISPTRSQNFATRFFGD